MAAGGTACLQAVWLTTCRCYIMALMQPTRVCQLITELRPGGAERCVYELATRLDRSRFDVQVSALRGGSVADELTAAGVAVTVLGVGCKCSPLVVGKVRSLAGLLKRERIDLLHTHLFHADLAGRLAARRAGVPHLVHTVHVAERRWRPWQFAFAKRTTGRCDRIVAVSQSVKDSHQARTGLADEHYTVIPNGVDTEVFRPDQDARERLRRQWQVGPNDVVAVFVGRLDRQKGVDVLLAAAKRFLAATPNATLLIAGDGPMRRKVERYCCQDDGPRYLGFVDDVRALLNAADLFVLPSRWEGWPLALGEAMSMGLPAIGASVAGIRDVIDPGRTGLLVPAENPAALADAMAELAGDADLRRRLGSAGQRRIRGGFSLGQYIAAHEALYESITARP